MGGHRQCVAAVGDICYDVGVAPLPTISNVYRCAFNWTNEDSPSVATNVMHFRKAGSNPAALWSSLDANVGNPLWEFQSTHSHIHEVVITPLDGGSVSFPVFTGDGADWTGAQSSEDMSPQVCNIVKFLTGKRGRSYRGRIFLPWVVESAATYGVLSSGGVSTCQSAWETFLAAMTGDGFDLVVASYLHSTAEDVVAVLAESTTATQRRRNRRLST